MGREVFRGEVKLSLSYHSLALDFMLHYVGTDSRLILSEDRREPKMG